MPPIPSRHFAEISREFGQILRSFSKKGRFLPSKIAPTSAAEFRR
jgi:hypothetical protein